MKPPLTARDRCPTCGDVMLTSDDITLRLCVDDPSRHSYNFICPECGFRVVQPAHRLIVELLSPHVRVESWFLPCELFEVHDGPPINSDDLLDFHLALYP